MAVPDCSRQYRSVCMRNFPIQADVTLKQETVANRNFQQGNPPRVRDVRTTLGGKLISLFVESFWNS